MNKHSFFVFAILLGLACPASLKAAVEEEYKSVEAIDAEQALVVEAQNQQAANLNVTTAKPVVIPANSSPAVPAGHPVAYASNQGDMILEAEAVQTPPSEKAVRITPMVGATLYHGALSRTHSWGDNIRNQYSFGLALEFPLSRYFAIEAEGGYSNHRVAYTPNIGPAVGYAFNQYLLGANGKVYLLDTKLRPFVGAGLTALIFDNMSRADGRGGRVPYNPVMGSANLMAGLEYAVSDSVAIGGRASWLLPVLNRPMTVDNGLTSAPGYEEAAILNTSLYRIMGTVSFKL